MRLILVLINVNINITFKALHHFSVESLPAGLRRPETLMHGVSSTDLSDQSVNKTHLDALQLSVAHANAQIFMQKWKYDGLNKPDRNRFMSEWHLLC